MLVFLVFFDDFRWKCWFSFSFWSEIDLPAVKTVVFLMLFGHCLWKCWFFVFEAKLIRQLWTCWFSQCFLLVFEKILIFLCFLKRHWLNVFKPIVFLKVAFLKSATVQRILTAKITKYQFYTITQPKMNTGSDPPDPPDPPDPVRELLLETYQPSRAGVEMTEVLNTLPQIKAVGSSTISPSWSKAANMLYE